MIPDAPKHQSNRTAAAQSRRTIAVRTRLGNYEIIGKIAEGGMGCVYHARHVLLDKPVAVKVLKDGLSNKTDILNRFRKEAQSLAKINHPAVVQVLDIGEDAGCSFIAMDFAPGMDLARWLARDGKLAPHNLVWIARQVMEGLAAAHEQGVLHRDIKPDNIIVDHLGTVKITDFGLAGDTRLAAAGQERQRFATPAYAAPEVLKSEGGDERSDVFSLGATLYHVATGELPFGKGNATAVLAAQAKGPRNLLEVAPAVSPTLSAIVMRCMAPDPGKRPANAGEALKLAYPDPQKRSWVRKLLPW